MKQYMIEIKLAQMTEEFYNLIPKQRRMVNQLFEEGTILSYTLTDDFELLWIVIMAENEKEVVRIIEKFPLIEYMSYNIHTLVFHNMVSNRLPSISLN
ncbi:MAG: hypothetical protein K1X92_12950 [Bacteroidia bacterium]|nr:hypothetical protein [Bacteroidia bacterium]